MLIQTSFHSFENASVITAEEKNQWIEEMISELQRDWVQPKNGDFKRETAHMFSGDTLLEVSMVYDGKNTKFEVREFKCRYIASYKESQDFGDVTQLAEA